MGSWGKKTRWAREQFTCLVPHGEMPPSKRPRQPVVTSTQANGQEGSCSPAVVEDDSVVPFSCSRCKTVVVARRIPSTGRPDLLTLAEHLETEGRCFAGVLLYNDAVTERTERGEILRRQDEAMLSAFLESQQQQQQKHSLIVTIWLMNPKTPQNMGSVLRAMSVYQDGAAVIYSGNRYDIAAKFSTDPHDGGVAIPKLHVHDMAHSMRFLASRKGGVSGAPPSCAPVAKESSSSAATRSAKFIAVDLISGATPLHKFVHEDDNNVSTSTPITPPPQPLVVGYLFGPEDGTLSAEVLAECDDAVYIPTKGSMNLAATVNVLLYDRQAKHLLRHPERLDELSADATGGRSINNQHSASQLR